MAELINLHRQPIVIQEQDEEALSPIQPLVSISNSYFNNNINGDDDEDDDANSLISDFDPVSPPNLPFFVSSSFRLQNLLSDSDSLSESDSDSYTSDSIAYTNCFYAEREIDFVTDMFESGDVYVPDCSISDLDPFSASFNNEFDFRVFDCSAHHRIRNDSDEYIEESSSPGLRVANIESDSDSDEKYPIYETGSISSGQVSNSGLPICWTSLGFDNQMMRTESEESDLGEVSTRAYVRDGPSSVINRIEEISVSSNTYTEDEQEEEIGEESLRDLEWEIILAVNNFERNLEFFIDGEFDDYMYAATNHYDSLFSHFLNGENASKASPVSKSVIENLPLVIFTKEELDKKNVACAICRNDVIVEETVTKLPCCHHYHRSCILPWLKMRNTCPVCRFELPTDDVECEGRKNGDDLQVREFGFENFD